MDKERFKKIRKQAGYTQVELSEYLGGNRNQGTVSRYESGEHKIERGIAAQMLFLERITNDK